MDPREALDERLTRLERDLAVVMERVRILEGHGVPHPTPPPQSPVVTPAPAVPATTDVTGLATLLGRTFMVFGGAYLLRALTDSGRLPGGAGVVIGLAYALFWLAAAWRAAPGHRASAQFHGVTGLLIGLPLIWEATTHFGLLGPGSAALAFGVLCTLALVIARRGRLEVVAGIAGFGTLAAAGATAIATNHHAAFSLLLIGLSLITYWLADESTRAWLRWPTAVAASLSVAGVTLRAMATPPLEPAWLALLTQAVLLATMQGSLAVRVIIQGRNMRLFDMLQAVSALTIGVGGAVLVAQDSAAGIGLIGAVTAILAIGAHLAAWFRLTDRPHLTASYHTFSTFGMVTSVIALILLLDGTMLAVAGLVFSLSALALGRRHLASYAILHAAAYLTTALSASGVLSLAWAGWVQTPSPWPSVPGLGWMCVLAAGLGARWWPLSPGATENPLARSGRIAMAWAGVFAGGGAIVVVLAPVVAGTPIDAGILASLRTMLLSLMVVVLGLSARFPGVAVLSRLVYPLLVIGGLRLLVDDFRHSQPSTLFLALAFYGAAWVLGPRLATHK